jgi:hypothetical protein
MTVRASNRAKDKIDSRAAAICLASPVADSDNGRDAIVMSFRGASSHDSSSAVHSNAYSGCGAAELSQRSRRANLQVD